MSTYYVYTMCTHIMGWQKSCCVQTNDFYWLTKCCTVLNAIWLRFLVIEWGFMLYPTVPRVQQPENTLLIRVCFASMHRGAEQMDVVWLYGPICFYMELFEEYLIKGRFLTSVRAPELYLQIFERPRTRVSVNLVCYLQFANHIVLALFSYDFCNVRWAAHVC